MLDDCNEGTFVVSQTSVKSKQFLENVSGKATQGKKEAPKKKKKRKRLKRLFIPGAQRVRSEDIQLSLRQPQAGGRNAGVVVGCLAS